jgi:hypothetical protein
MIHKNATLPVGWRFYLRQLKESLNNILKAVFFERYF